MLFTVITVLFVAAMFAAMFALQAWGRRIGEEAWRREPDKDRGGVAAETAVFALLGLFIAFTFSGAGARFDERRDLVVQEANAIGTAWLRIDVLPADRQPQIRDLFRRYVDARLERYDPSAGRPAADAADARALTLQGEIWSATVGAIAGSGQTTAYTVALPALNDMFDIVTTREAVALLKHPPVAVFIMLFVLALIGSVFAGYGMARNSRSSIHTWGFTCVMALALYVIIDLEFPRLGLIRVDSADALLVDVRAAMN